MAINEDGLLRQKNRKHNRPNSSQKSCLARRSTDTDIHKLIDVSPKEDNIILLEYSSIPTWPGIKPPKLFKTRIP